MSDQQSVDDLYNYNYHKAQDRELALQLEAIRAATKLYRAWIMTDTPTMEVPFCVKSANELLGNLFKRYI